MNTSELKQTLVARACSYELAQAIADEIERLRIALNESEAGELRNALAVGQAVIELQEERKEIDRLRAENERVYEEGVSRLMEAQKINNREIESLRADLNAAKTALENQIAHTTEIANLCARQRAWIDGVMAQGPKFYWNECEDTFAYAEDAGIMALCTPLFTRPAPFEDK